MTFGATVLVISLCLVVALALVVAQLLKDLKTVRAELKSVAAERDTYRSELGRARMLMERSSEINKGAADEKKKLDGPDAFAQSLSILSKRTAPGR